MPRSLLLLLVPLLLAGCLEADTTPDPTASQEAKPETVFCTQDVRTCADGTVVARDPALGCDFPSCSTIKITSTMPSSQIQLSKLPKTDCTGTGQTACPVAGDAVVRITTNLGEIWIKLFPKETPKTVENFVGLAERGYYNGIIFHRVIPEFMIQGGDPEGRGTGGTSIWGTDFEDEFTTDLSNLRGALSMANRGPATNGSQFFIVQAKGGTQFLDGRHTVFGQTFAGLEVVDAIALTKRDAADKPLKPVTMEKVEAFTVIE